MGTHPLFVFWSNFHELALIARVQIALYFLSYLFNLKRSNSLHGMLIILTQFVVISENGLSTFCILFFLLNWRLSFLLSVHGMLININTIGGYSFNIYLQQT